MASITTVVVGLGVHGSAMARLLPGVGVRVLGAADPRHAGADLGDIAEAPELCGITVAADPEDLDWHADIDLAILTAKVPVDTLASLAVPILQRGIDVVTIVEDAFDLERFAPEAHRIIHEAALAGGASFVVTGSQDALWAGLVIQMSSQARGLRGIEISTHLGVDGYPEEFLSWCGIGNTPEQFERSAAVAAETPSVFGAVLPVIADALGLTVISEDRTLEPYAIDTDLESQTLGRVIAAGDPIGRRDTVTASTAEGISLRAELITSAVMGEDAFRAHFDATPSIDLQHRLEPANLSVDAVLINRIPDVLAAPPGFIRTIDLPTPRYRVSLSSGR